MKVKKFSIWTLVLVLGICLSTVVFAAADTKSATSSGKKRLTQFFEEVTSLQANFVQRVDSQEFSKTEISKGSLRMMRPGKFRWDYRTPFEQQITADGTNLWIYDMDLDQVIVKPLDQAIGNTPAVLLSGNADLSERFSIKDVKPPKQDASLTWVELKPIDTEAGFQLLLLGFGKELKKMVLTDAFSQTTTIEFIDLIRNPELDSDIFDFQPPPGIDVLGEREK